MWFLRPLVLQQEGGPRGESLFCPVASGCFAFSCQYRLFMPTTVSYEVILLMVYCVFLSTPTLNRLYHVCGAAYEMQAEGRHSPV